PWHALLAMVGDYPGRNIPSVENGLLCGGTRADHGSEENHHPGRPTAKSEKHQPGNPAQYAHGHHRALGFWQILACVRYALCRRTAAVCRVAVGLRAAVPGSNGAPGGGFGRRTFSLDRYRAEDHHALAPVNGWH